VKKVRPTLSLRAEIDLPTRTPCNNFYNFYSFSAGW
jgi:hypothetical protein